MGILPWQQPPLAGWRIEYMLHSDDGRERVLSVLMQRGGAYISARGTDDAEVFEELARKALVRG